MRWVALLALLCGPVWACTPLYGGAYLTQAGCYRFHWDIIDPITVNGAGITIDLEGKTLGCRGARGVGFDVIWAPGLVIRNGVISGCDFAINAYLNGYVGTGVMLENLVIESPSVRGIQLHADNATIQNVAVRNVGPSRDPAYCLVAGVEVLGRNTRMVNVHVETIEAIGPIPACEALGVSLSGGQGAMLYHVSVDNSALPQQDGQFGLWVSLEASGARLFHLVILNMWDEIAGNVVIHE